MQFSKEAWDEIYVARARLAAIKDKIQPYPAYPEESQQESRPQVVEHIHRTSNMGAKDFDLLQQTALKTQYLDEKFTEHLEFKKKPQPVKSSGKGIKIEP